MALSQKTVDKAISTLDGMREITKNDMLIRGQYITDVVNNDLKEKGAVCGGRRACLVGSAYLSYGVKLQWDEWEEDFELPGLLDRADFRKRRPGLKLAMDALNEAAGERIQKFSVRKQRQIIPSGLRDDYYGPDADADVAEALFEGTTILTDRQEMLDLITRAKRIVRRKQREAA